MLTRHEVQALWAALDWMAQIMAMPLYGSGLRLMEYLRLRVKDSESNGHEILVREGKGKPALNALDGMAMLSAAVMSNFRAQLELVRRLHAAAVPGCRARPLGCAAEIWRFYSDVEMEFR